MKPAPFHYAEARSIDEALALLAQHGADARILAGGQSLGPMLNLRTVRPSHLIDISRIAALRSIDERADGSMRLGAGVTHAQLEDRVGQSALSHYLATVAAEIGYRAIRTRGTVAGSLAHADPAADWPVALAALGALVTVASTRGERSIPIGELITGLFETGLAAADVITAIEIPPPARFAWGFRKIVRKTGEFAHAIAASVVRSDESVDLWLGALDGTPRRIATDRGNVYESVQAAIATSDEYARHLHAHNAALAVSEAVARWQ